MRVTFTLLIVVLLLSLLASAQQFVYPRPAPSKITVHRNLEFKSVDGRTTRFDVYRPARTSCPSSSPATSARPT